jgi:hypothetical protein
MTDPDSKAAFHAAMADVDVLIDESYAFDPSAYTASSFKDGYGFDGAGARIYREDGLLGGTSGTGMDWFEGANANPSVVLADFVAAIHKTADKRTYLRLLDEKPVVMTADDCKKQLVVCKDIDEAAPIDSPCERYNSCAVEKKEEKKEDPKVQDESACIAAGLFMIAAAFA